MLRNVNRLKTLVNDEGQMTNDSLSQLALIAPIYLVPCHNTDTSIWEHPKCAKTLIPLIP
ncbi:hypothetical protein LC605_21990 [Nostoc sp. CHAB 5836]|nr:hypothetical protein [Nostoc sp. CHAB 5836]